MSKDEGLHAKYEVRRTDGRDGPGGPHEECFLFILDVDHDPLAVPALRTYAEAARKAGYHALADDLLAYLDGDEEEKAEIRGKL
jgi:hypothetical protein